MSPKALFALKLHINSMLLNNKKFFKAISYNFGLAFFRDIKSDFCKLIIYFLCMVAFKLDLLLLYKKKMIRIQRS